MAATVTIVGGADRQLQDLLRACRLRTTVMAPDGLPALVHPAATPPDLLVVDLRQQTELPPAVASVKRQHPTTAIVIVASKLDPAQILEAMRAGVNEWVTEPLTLTDLEAAVGRVLSRGPAPTRGEVFAFVGAKGGVGTTTLAVNVATALAKASRSSQNGGRTRGGDRPGTVLIDLHLSHGDAAVFLGAEPRYSVVDAIENLHRVDEAYFHGLTVASKSGLEVLASADRPVARAIEAPQVRTLIDTAARYYRYTVLDVPRGDTVLLDALDSVNRIVMVTSQELSAVRSASRLATLLRQRYGKDRVKLAVSRYQLDATIGCDDLERVIGLQATELVPSDYRLALDALNRGRPLILDNHSRLADAIERLAGDLTGQVVTDAPARRDTGFLGMFRGRRP